MKLLLAGWLALALIFMAIPIQANESWLLYDDFNGTPLEFFLGKPLDPGKWVPRDSGSALDTAREIRWNKLHLLNRTYSATPNTFSSTIVRLQFPATLAPLVTAMQATVTVTSFKVTGGVDGLPSRLRGGRLSGFFFNTVSDTQNQNLGDILAAIYVEGLSDSPQTLRVVAHVEQCNDSDCNGTTPIFNQDFGSIRVGQPARLVIQWDTVNRQFLFQRDWMQASYPYSGDVFGSSNPAKRIDVSQRAVNSGAGEVAVAAMEVLVDDVYVNASAVSTP
jgi:hypothetical protein